MTIGSQNSSSSYIGAKTDEEKQRDSFIGASASQPEAMPQAPRQVAPQSAEADISGNVIKEESPSLGDYALDVVLSPFRGAEGAAESVYGLVDYLTGDNLLKDWDRDEHNLFGTSKTLLGEVGEGFFQFAAGFVPGTFGVGMAGRAFQASKLGKSAGTVTKAMGKLVKGNKTLDIKTLKTLSKLKKGTKAAVQAGTAGMLADFVVWKGQEERMSNMLQTWGLADEDNDIVNWMKYDPDKDEGELEGRFKNALEGIVLGNLLELGFRGAKKGVQLTKEALNIPEKDKALSGLAKIFGKFREKDKHISEQIARGEEPDELAAITHAMEVNGLDDEEIRAIKELHNRKKDAGKAEEFERVNETKIKDQPKAPSVEKLGESPNLKESKFDGIDVETASEEALDSWFRKNTNIAPTTMSLESKRAAAKDILGEAGKGGVESKLSLQVEEVLEKAKKAGYLDETNPQAALSAIRAVGDVPELRALFEGVAEMVADKAKNVKVKSGQALAEGTAGLIKKGVEAAGGKGTDIDLSHLRGSVEDLKRVRAEAEVLFEALHVSVKQIKEAKKNYKEAADKNNNYVVTKLDGTADEITMNSDEAWTELYNSLERFMAVQEIWADFGTQFSLGLRRRQELYETGATSLGRDIAGGQRTLGLDLELAKSRAGRAWRQEKTKGFSQKRIVKDLDKLFKESKVDLGEENLGVFITGLKSMDSAPTSKLGKFLIARHKGLAVTQEWYYNAILSNPQTWAVNVLSGALVLPLRHIESMIGGALSGRGDIVKANMRVMFDIESFTESLKFAWRSFTGDEARSIKGYTGYTDDRLLQEGGEIRFKNPEGNTLKHAVNHLGTFVRFPSRVMMGTDEFFKQMSFRSRTKTALAVEGYRRGLHKQPKKLAEFIDNGFNELITKDGRFRNEHNVLKEARLERARMKEAGETIPKGFIDDYLNKHYRDNDLKREDGFITSTLTKQQRDALVEEGTDWALVNTFTNEVENAFFKRTGELAMMHPMLSFVIPFVKTPSNVILFALGRVSPFSPIKELGALKKEASLLGDINIEDEIAAQTRNRFEQQTGASSKHLSLDEVANEMGINLSEAKKQAENHLSMMTDNQAIKRAEAIGRMSVGVMTLGAMVSNIERIKDRVTGAAPEDPGRRQAWENTGKMPYSIKFGDKWFSYQRFDPFATMLGIVADMVHMHDGAMKEAQISEYDITEEYKKQQPYAATLAGVLVSSLAANITNKSYLKNIGDLFDMLETPAESGVKVGKNILTSLAVPSALSAGRGFFEEDPALLEARTLMDKIRSRLPESLRSKDPEDIVSPRRNFLGEIVRREKLEGLGGVVNPVYFSTASNDIVDLELEAHNVGRNVPQVIQRMADNNKYDLSSLRNAKGDTAHSRLLDLMSTMKIGRNSLTLRQELRNIIESNEYQSLPPVTDTNFSKDHPRTKLITRAFSKYKSRAKEQLFRELGDFIK